MEVLLTLSFIYYSDIIEKILNVLLNFFYFANFVTFKFL